MCSEKFVFFDSLLIYSFLFTLDLLINLPYESQITRQMTVSKSVRGVKWLFYENCLLAINVIR